MKRDAEKKAKEEKKNARFAQSITIPSRAIRSSSFPPLDKFPRSKELLNYQKYFFAWNISEADLEGEWSWGEPREWSDIEYSTTIEPHFSGQINNTWREVEIQTYNGAGGRRNRSNKYQPLDSVVPEAQRRWGDFEVLMQFDTLFRCRLGTNIRVWGVRVQNHFYVVWYERHHNICPVNNTN